MTTKLLPLLLAVLFTTCKSPNQEPDIPKISINPKEITMDENGGQFNVELTTNWEYDIIMPSEATWLTNTGSNGTTIGFKVESGPNIAERTAKVIFKTKNSTVSETLTVIQRNSIDETGILRELYAAMDGSNWTQSTNWNSTKPLNEWFGIQTNADGRVSSISLINNNLNGTIPNSIFNLSSLESLEIGSGSGRVISFSDISRIVKLTSLRTLRLSALNMGNSFPTDILNLTALETLSISSVTPRIINVPKEIWSLSNLKEMKLSGQFLRVTLAPEMGTMINMTSMILETQIDGDIPKELAKLTQLKKLHLNFQRDGIKYYGATSGIPIEIGQIAGLEELVMTNGNLIGTLPETIGDIVNLKKFTCSGNKLSGQIPLKITNHPNWALWNAESNILPQRDGYQLYPTLYTSSDYSQDGKIVKLQIATRGQGIDLVLMGDGFVDRDMTSGGKYEQRMRAAMNHFFDIEPTKSYREYFNVYMIKVVSANEAIGISGATTALSVQFGEGTSISGDNQKCFNYASNISGISIPNSVVNVVVNSPKYAGTCWNYTDGSAIAYVPYIDNIDSEFAKVVHHEVIGHGFSKLLDEYIYYDRYLSPEEISSFNERRTRFNMGWNMTVEKNNVPWQHFIGHPKYTMVGMYEGGFFCSRGIWRAEENQCMNNNVPYFNGPSRELFVKRVKKIASEQYSWDEFVLKDRYEPLVTKSTLRDESRPRLAPPVMVDSDWRGVKSM